ncbi:MAG: serine/threonine protein kinase [Sandaracinaceae bacterium]|nr:serine/threonine protein kinase [Sandaracinaceae bacterium]
MTTGAEHLKLVPAPAEPPPDPLVGQTVDGRYLMEGVLGQGGMGVVYRAKHVVLGKPLAMKVLKADVSKDQEIIARFRQEAQSASGIGSQHIIDISDFGQLADGSTYFVMELLDGQELTKAIENERPIPPERVVHIAKQLCDALGAAHERGIVHRDMKPDNVFLVKRGKNEDFVKVLDFGIAKVGGANSKLTRAGQVFGTPHYTSPEQCSGQPVDHRTDIYALGVILYEMACGRVPFDADNLMGILTKHIYEQPIPPHTLPPPIEVPAGLEAVILKCLAKQADARYQSMADVRADLEAFEKGQTPNAVVEAVDRKTAPLPDPTGSHSVMQVEVGGAAQPEGGSKLPLILGFLFGLALIAGGAVALYLFVLAPEPEMTVVEQDPPPPPPLVEDPPVEEPVAEEPTAEIAVEGTPPVQEQPAAPPPIRIVSEPAGVEVWSDGALLGNTPFDVPRPARGESLMVTLKQPASRTTRCA